MPSPPPSQLKAADLRYQGLGIPKVHICAALGQTFPPTWYTNNPYQKEPRITHISNPAALFIGFYPRDPHDSPNLRSARKYCQKRLLENELGELLLKQP